MKILVTGGAGFIGSHTCVELLEAGHDVVILDDLSNASGTVVDKIETITGKRPAFYQADAKDRAVLHEIFTAHRIDAVVHFAGFKAVGESCHIPLAYYRNNLDSTLALLEEMAQAGCTRFVFSSSATVYGPDNAIPYVETMPPYVATSPYGWTKVMIEQILRDYCTATPGFTAVLLRYFNPIGGHPSGLLGDDPNGIPNNLMPYIARVAAGHLPPRLSACRRSGQGPSQGHRLCHGAHGRGGLQSGHRPRRERAGAGEHVYGGHRRERALCHRPAPRG